MRQFKFILIFLIVANINCKPVAYFNTPNDIFRKDCTVYMLDGIEKNGKITIMFETGHDADRSISLMNDNHEEKISMESIKSYKINEDYYFPKIIDLEFNGSDRLLFVKRLTQEKSRIQMYELHQQKKQTADGEDHFFYFISLPMQGRLETWNVGGQHFSPHFEEKMSDLVEDCPALSNKIQQKEKGYFLAQLTSSNFKRVEVLKRIIDEYNDCH